MEEGTSAGFLAYIEKFAYRADCRSLVVTAVALLGITFSAEVGKRRACNLHFTAETVGLAVV